MRTRSWLVVVLVALCLMMVAGVASAQVVDYKPLTLSDGPAEVPVGETPAERNPFAPTGSVVASLDGGPMFGAAFSWEVYEVWDLPLYLDLGFKRQEAGTDWFAGASTDAMGLLDKFPIIRYMVPLLDRVFPEGTCLMYGYLLDAGEPMVALRTPLTKF